MDKETSLTEDKISVHRKRLNPEDIKQFDGILSPDWVCKLVNVCDSPTTENK